MILLRLKQKRTIAFFSSSLKMTTNTMFFSLKLLIRMFFFSYSISSTLHKLLLNFSFIEREKKREKRRKEKFAITIISKYKCTFFYSLFQNYSFVYVCVCVCMSEIFIELGKISNCARAVYWFSSSIIIFIIIIILISL